MDKSITIVVPILAKPECREIVKARLLKLATQTRREKGNVFYVLHEATDDSSRFVIYERWADGAALDLHMNKEYLKRFLTDSAAWLREPIAGIPCREIKAGQRDLQT